MSSPYGNQQSGFAAPHGAEPTGYSQVPGYGTNDGYGGNPYGGGQPAGYGQPSPYAPMPYQNPYPMGVPGYVQPQTNPLALTSLILSLVGLAVGITAPVGLILGIVARKQIKAAPHQYSGDGMALGGIIAGAIITGLWVLFWIAYIAFIAWIVAGSGGY